MFDVDRLRQVNESLGHAAGDKVLVEVANRLRS
ncbi:diguanylate cyclase, partial [Micromonospora sp. NPDC023633]